MDSGLRIKDKAQSEKYMMRRQREVNLACGFLLLLRLVSLMYRVLGFESMKVCVAAHLYLACGIGINIVALLCSLKWKLATRLLSGIVLLSFVNI